MLSGDNIRFTADGVLSAYGDTLLIDEPVTDGEGIQSIRIVVRGTVRTIYYTEDAFLEYDEVLGGMKPIYVFPEIPAIQHRATAVYLNDFIFMCQPTIGIVFLNILDNTTGILDVPGLPEAPLAITENKGRLVVITKDVVTWSNTTDGFDFFPQLGGAGFQKINEIVPGDALMIAQTVESVLVFTTGGILRGDFTGDAVVYRWDGVKTEFRAINSFCVFTSGESDVVFLAQQGFFSTKGREPQPFTPIFNEFLIRELLKFKFLEGANARVEWDELNQMLYLSLSESDITAAYDFAYALYKPLDKWGRFSRQHFGILPITIQTSQRRGNRFGYADLDNRLHVWNGEPFITEITDDATAYLYRPLIPHPNTKNEARTRNIMCSTGVANVLEDSALGFPGGYLTFDATNPVELNTKDQAAFARIGLFRFTEAQYPDELSEVSDITVGSILSSDGATPVEDFNLVPDGTSDEDFNLVAGAEDFGFGRVNFVNFQLKIIATNDGRTEYVSDLPGLARFEAAQRFYVTQVNGIHHIIELKTLLPGDTFHLETLELNGILAGRLI